MSGSTLLTYIATTVSSRHTENVATATLAWVMLNDEFARRAFTAMVARQAGTELPEDVGYSTQWHISGSGRPDLAGFSDEREVVLVEAKLTAGLGLDQVSRYFDALQNGGVLVLLTPQASQAITWREALRQLGEPTPTPGDARRFERDGRRITSLGWDDVIDEISRATTDPARLAELAQLRDLIDHSLANVYLPLSVDDVGAARGRLFHRLGKLTDALIGHLNHEQYRQSGIVVDGTMRGGTWGAGAKGSIHGRTAWVGLWLPLWAESGATPFWLQIQDVDAAAGPVLTAAINTCRVEEEPARYRAPERDICVPLVPPLGASEAELLNGLGEQLIVVAQAVQPPEPVATPPG